MSSRRAATQRRSMTCQAFQGVPVPSSCWRIQRRRTLTSPDRMPSARTRSATTASQTARCMCPTAQRRLNSSISPAKVRRSSWRRRRGRSLPRPTSTSCSLRARWSSMNSRRTGLRSRPPRPSPRRRPPTSSLGLARPRSSTCRWTDSRSSPSPRRGISFMSSAPRTGGSSIASRRPCCSPGATTLCRRSRRVTPRPWAT